MIDVDEATMLPINFRIFYLDLVEANASGVPEWKQLIDYVKDYDLVDGVTSPDSLHEFLIRMTQEKHLFWKY